MPTSLRHKRVACQRLERHGPCCPALSRMDSGRVAGVGFLLPGDVWYDLIDGLPVSFRQLGLEERKHFIPVIRDWNFKASIAKPVRIPFVRVQSVIYLHPVTEKCGAERPGSFARTNGKTEGWILATAAKLLMREVTKQDFPGSHDRERE